MFRFNIVIRVLLFSDLFVVLGFGFIEPIFAVFISDNIAGATLAAIGIASGIFSVTQSIVQIFFSRRVDRCDDTHDRRWLFRGTLLVSLTPIIYLFATDISHIYFAQVINGIGAGLAYPSWLGLWSTHLDKGKESFEWSFYSTIIGIASATAAVLGGLIASTFGFHTLFMTMWAISFSGAFLVLLLPRPRLRRKR